MQLIVHAILRLLFIILMITDFRLKRQIKKKDYTAHVEITQSQKIQKIANYVLFVVAMILPFGWAWLLLEIACLVYFFIFTDREIEIGRHRFYMRGKVYQIAQIKNIHFKDDCLTFQYQREELKLSHPLVDPHFLNENLIKKVEKRKHKEH